MMPMWCTVKPEREIEVIIMAVCTAQMRKCYVQATLLFVTIYNFKPTDQPIMPHLPVRFAFITPETVIEVIIMAACAAQMRNIIY